MTLRAFIKTAAISLLVGLVGPLLFALAIVGGVWALKAGLAMMPQPIACHAHAAPRSAAAA